MKAYQIKITLLDVKPPVWRRLLVPKGLSFADIAETLIRAMGWQGYHMYGFTIPKLNVVISEPDDDAYSVDSMFSMFHDVGLDAGKTKFDKYAKPGTAIYFEYDFGDGWRHKIDIEKVLDEGGMKCPKVVKYKGDCPPEDVGGPWGYMEFLETVSDPSNPEHAETLEWAAGQMYEPYDMDAANERIETMFADPGECEGRFASPNHIYNVLRDFESDDDLRAAFGNAETAFGAAIIRGKPVNDLRRLLKSKNADYLRTAASAMCIEGGASMKKAEAVDALYDLLESKNVFFAINQLIDDEQRDFLKDIFTRSDEPYYIEGDGFPHYEVAKLLLDTFAISAWHAEDGRIGILAVDEAKKKYGEFLDEIIDVVSDWKDKLEMYASAAANLYGVMTFADFAALYSYADPESGMDMAELRGLLQLIFDRYADDGKPMYALRGDFLVSDMLADQKLGKIRELHSLAQASPRRLLSKDDFLEYAYEDHYEENEFTERLAGFISRKLGPKASEDEVDAILCMLSWCVRQSGAPSDCLDILKEAGVRGESREEADALREMIEGMACRARMWALNGSTPNEAFGESKRPSNVIPFRRPGAKVGRNEPCPCGSGKKYKNCCGKAGGGSQSEDGGDDRPEDGGGGDPSH